jgi:trimethylamine:corrinoid methyltransferase-like protein
MDGCSPSIFLGHGVGLSHFARIDKAHRSQSGTGRERARNKNTRVKFESDFNEEAIKRAPLHFTLRGGMNAWGRARRRL